MTFGNSGNKEAKAPALEGGLTILDILSEQKEGAGFEELLGRVQLSRGSLARILKIMVERKYVMKNNATGRYSNGERMLRFAMTHSSGFLWGQAAMPVLRTLSDTLCNTVLLFYWNGKAVQCVAKVVHPQSIVMQELGTVSTELHNTPWGWLIHVESGSGKLPTGKSSFPMDPEILQKCRSLGYADDHGTLFPGVRRISVPVHDREQNMIGCLAVGGTVFNITDEMVQHFIRPLQKAAETIRNINPF